MQRHVRARTCTPFLRLSLKSKNFDLSVEMFLGDENTFSSLSAERKLKIGEVEETLRLVAA